jgi:hypothetical protein
MSGRRMLRTKKDIIEDVGSGEMWEKRRRY